jgi:hypothetical protein
MDTKLVLRFIWNLLLIFCGAYAIDYMLSSDIVWVRLSCILPAYTLFNAYGEIRDILSKKD